MYRTTLKSPTFFHVSPPLPEEYPAFRIKLVSVSSFVHPCSRATSGRYVAEYRLAWWVKDMRRPWVPRVQSSGVEQGVKAVRRVTDTERCGSSGLCMGGKRVSSYALFNVCTGRGVWWLAFFYFVLSTSCDGRRKEESGVHTQSKRNSSTRSPTQPHQRYQYNLSNSYFPSSHSPYST